LLKKINTLAANFFDVLHSLHEQLIWNKDIVNFSLTAIEQSISARGQTLTWICCPQDSPQFTIFAKFCHFVESLSYHISEVPKIYKQSPMLSLHTEWFEMALGFIAPRPLMPAERLLHPPHVFRPRGLVSGGVLGMGS
jgi:hypothetical protein